MRNPSERELNATVKASRLAASLYLADGDDELAADFSDRADDAERQLTDLKKDTP
jgi:hypothetical protein